MIRKAGVQGDDRRSSRFTLGEYSREHRTYCEVAGLGSVGPLQIEEDETRSLRVDLMGGEMATVGEGLLVGKQRASVDVKETFGSEPLGARGGARLRLYVIRRAL
ncbi:hypothetical protein [Sorangium sp. So ce233]|uniref:hypothetical protein n=1 Tax=Sorangium sp. So ce233 TaxID=3133290 RepID=UPI003F60F864